MAFVVGEQHVKIGFYMFFPGGGIGRYTHNLAGAMTQQAGAEVEVICSPDYEWLSSADYRVWPGLKSIFHDNSLLRRMLFLRGQFVNPRTCVEHIEEEDFDVVHFSNINHLTFPFWKSGLANGDVVVAATAHDVRRKKSIISRWWEEEQLKSFYRFADLLFVHSVYQSRDLIDYAGVDPEKIKIVPHGLYPHGEVSGNNNPYDELAASKSGRPVLFFGQIRDDKNLDGLVRALSICSSDIHLIVAGASNSRHRNISFYEGIAADEGVVDQVSFLDRYIPDEDVGMLFDAVDWVALPYHHSFTSQSGALNTSVHYRKPVLVSGAPVLRETVDLCDVGITCEGESPASIARGIDRMEERMSRGHVHEFDEYSRRFSWSKNARKTLDVYRKHIHRHSSNA